MQHFCETFRYKDETAHGYYQFLGLDPSNFPGFAENEECRRSEVYRAIHQAHASPLVTIRAVLEKCRMSTSKTDACESAGGTGCKSAPVFNMNQNALVMTLLTGDVLTAKALLDGGLDPHIVMMQRGTTALHMAATLGADDVLEAMLASAHRMDVGSGRKLQALVLSLDAYDRTPHAVCVTDLARCLLDAAQNGIPPAASACATAPTPNTTKWNLKVAWINPINSTSAAAGAGVKEERDKYRKQNNVIEPEVSVGTETGTETEAATEAATEQEAEAEAGGAFTVKGRGGWQVYTGRPPLASDLSSPTYCDISEVSGNITGQEFVANFQSLRRPVIFRGAGKHFPAFAKWTKKYMKEKGGKIKVMYDKIPYGSLRKGKRKFIKFGKFLKQMAGVNKGQNKTLPPWYVFDLKLLGEKKRNTFVKDLVWPAMFEEFTVANKNGQGIGQSKWQFIVGPEGSGAPFHSHVWEHFARLSCLRPCKCVCTHFRFLKGC